MELVLFRLRRRNPQLCNHRVINKLYRFHSSITDQLMRFIEEPHEKINRSQGIVIVHRRARNCMRAWSAGKWNWKNISQFLSLRILPIFWSAFSIPLPAFWFIFALVKANCFPSTTNLPQLHSHVSMVSALCAYQNKIDVFMGPKQDWRLHGVFKEDRN